VHSARVHACAAASRTGRAPTLPVSINAADAAYSGFARNRTSVSTSASLSDLGLLLELASHAALELVDQRRIANHDRQRDVLAIAARIEQETR